jgi:hypothetical protein
MLVEFLIVIAPGSALMVYILRFIKRSNTKVTIARMDTVRADARWEAAQDASAIANETARTALGQTTEALSIARTIETVGEQVAGLTEYLVAKIDGEPPARRQARHARALPSGNDLPAITDRIIP